MPTLADKTVTLPTLRLLAVGWAGPLVVGLGWAGLGSVVAGRSPVAIGLAAAGVVGAASTLAILVLRPWRARSMAQWPMIWVAGSFARVAMSLGGALLLYSATPLRSPSLWLAVMVAYLAALIGETRVYVHCMQRLGAPAIAGKGIAPQGPEPATGTGPLE
jgi:hypothetical protein